MGLNVLHLSTALAPVHRDLIVNRVKQRLRNKIDNWTLVATSCVESGMDFSFRTGFRERASTASLIQIGGRISRGAEYIDAEVWDILLRDDLFRENPAMTISRRALGNFTYDELNKENVSELSTKAMQREWTAGAEEKAKNLIELEQSMEYPGVGAACRVIDADTRTVLIDQSLADALRNGNKVSKTEIMQYSVQLWANKIEKLALESVVPSVNKASESSIYSWSYDYDADFLGYMAGVLKLDEFIAAGGGII
jgi:CRISPR-associated endonuclease/helicase Cas3